ncbi:MAG TPA: hypothetical protein VFW44_04005 [Bryobacteraceae bacterium]|nr:hypothetical protein [Bryobacteraceae bacterium]
MRRFLLALSAAAALLLGLEKVGLYHFIPAGETGFEAAPLPGHAGYSLRHSNAAGNLTSWLRLVVRPQGAPAIEFSAMGWSGDPLSIVSRPLPDGSTEVTVSKQPNPPQGAPFVWGAGLELKLVETTPGADSTLEDWAVFPSNQAPDSLELAARRRQWTRISWALLALSAIGAIVTALKEKDTEAVTTRTLAGAMINDIVGDNDAETKKLRGFMKKVVLEEVPVDQALTQVGFPPPDTWEHRRPRFQFQAKAVNLFLERVDIVVAEFDRYTHRLRGN